MSGRESLFGDLDAAIQSGSSERRSAALRRVTDLFLCSADRLGEAELGLFDDVLGRLSEQIEAQARAELSQRLAGLEKTPARTVRGLAFDQEAAVAAPMLTTSNHLDADDLLELAKTRGQAHLLAISKRNQLDASVTEILVDRGDNDVVQSVSVNPGAEFSAVGMGLLAQRVENDDDLARRIGASRVPPTVFRQLLYKATEAARERLLSSASSSNAKEIHRILGTMSTDIAGAVGAPRDYAQAEAAIGRLVRQRQLREESVHEFAEAQKTEEAVAALASLCGAPVDVLDRLLSSDRVDALLIPCKAAGFKWPTARAVMKLHANAGAATLTDFGPVFREYAKLSKDTAKRVLRFWQDRRMAHARPPAAQAPRPPVPV